MMISVIIYIVLALGHTAATALGHSAATQDAMQTFLTQSSVTFHMFSGATWRFTIGDLLIFISLILMFFEIVKATRTTRRELLNHGLSALTFVIALVLFITAPAFSTSVFFFIVVMTAIDTVGGYTIGIVAAEHDLGMGKAGTD
jgi:hypothetical protein